MKRNKKQPFPHPPTSNHVMCNVMFSTLRITCSPLRCCRYLPDVDSNMLVQALHSFFFFCFLPSVLFTTSSFRTFFSCISSEDVKYFRVGIHSSHNWKEKVKGAWTKKGKHRIVTWSQNQESCCVSWLEVVFVVVMFLDVIWHFSIRQ